MELSAFNPGVATMTTTTRACLLAVTLLAGSSVSMAQPLPGQGMTMDDVQRNFGAPAYDLGAVGHPAITRWVYDGFTVYFEGRRVISTVQTQPLGATGAAPAASAPASVPASRPAEPVAVPARTVAPAPIAPAPATTPVAAPVAPAATPAPWSTPKAEVKAEPKPVFTAQAPKPAPVVIETPVSKPAPFTPPPSPATIAAPAPATPAATPAPAAAPAKTTKSGNSFRFDPETGRLILEDEAAPATEAPVATTTTTEPATNGSETPAATGDVGTALDQTLEFDPETGTFRAR